MGGGRTAEGAAIYKRVGGKYVRIAPYKNNKEVQNEPEAPKTFRDKLYEASTKEELLTVLREKYDTQSDFVEKNDIEKVKRVIGTLEDMKERYPMLGNFVRRLYESDSGIASMDTLGGLSINSEYYKENGKVCDKWYRKERGWFPPNATPESMIAHEFGHAMHNLYFQKLLTQPGADFFKLLKQKRTGTYLRDIEKKVMKKVGAKTKMDLYQQISGYTMACHINQSTKGLIVRVGVFEAIAESFHDVYSNGDNAAPASKAFVEELVKALQ